MPLLPAFLSLAQQGCPWGLRCGSALLPHGKDPAGAELSGWHSTALRPALRTVAPDLGEESLEREKPGGVGCGSVLTLCLLGGHFRTLATAYAEAHLDSGFQKGQQQNP